GQGIKHFSLVYVSPIAPQVAAAGAQDVPGADTFNGALSASVLLPSFQSLGQSVAPSLVYRSSWAKPTVLVSNSVNNPNPPMNQVIQNATHDGFLGMDNSQSTDNLTTTLVPHSMSAQFYTTSINADVPTMDLTGTPKNAILSYAFDLIDPATQKYLPSNVYPY